MCGCGQLVIVPRKDVAHAVRQLIIVRRKAINAPRKAVTAHTAAAPPAETRAALAAADAATAERRRVAAVDAVVRVYEIMKDMEPKCVSPG